MRPLARKGEMPAFVLRELFAFLTCGILAHGFARVHCSACGKDALVAFVQRFGSALNLNPHLHVLVLDGVCARLTPDGPLLFHRLPDPTDAEIGQLLATLRKRLQLADDASVIYHLRRPFSDGTRSHGPDRCAAIAPALAPRPTKARTSADDGSPGPSCCSASSTSMPSFVPLVAPSASSSR